MSLLELFHGRRILRPGEIIPGGPEYFKLKLTGTERTIPLGDPKGNSIHKICRTLETFR